MRKLGLLLFFGLVLSSLAFSTAPFLYDQGTGARDSSGLIKTGNLTIQIWDSPTGGNLLWEKNYTDAIKNGSWVVLIDNLSFITYSGVYYKDYKINGVDMDFDGNERIAWMSPLGIINSSYINTSQIQRRVNGSCSASQAIRVINEDGSVVCVSVSGSSGLTDTDPPYLYDNGSTVFFNETKLNQTINALENDTLGGLSCSNGESVKWNGSAWVCANVSTRAVYDTDGDTGINPELTPDEDVIHYFANGTEVERLNETMVRYYTPVTYESTLYFTQPNGLHNISTGSIGGKARTLDVHAMSNSGAWGAGFRVFLKPDIGSEQLAISTMNSNEFPLVFIGTDYTSGVPTVPLFIRGSSSGINLYLQSNATNFGESGIWLGAYTSGAGGAKIRGIHDPVGSGYEGALVFETSGSAANSYAERMRISYNGNVGIGTTNPSTKLTISGPTGNWYTGPSLLIESSGTSAALSFGVNTNYAWIQSINSQPLRINEGGNSISFGGNVGIGTNTPISKLHIVSAPTSSSGGFLVLSPSSGGADLRIGSASTYGWIQSHGGSPLRINELGNNVILNLRGGKVGIGINSPQEKLHIYNGGDSVFLQIQSNVSNTSQIKFVHGAYSTYLGPTNISGENYVDFWSYENAKMRIAANNTEAITIVGKGPGNGVSVGINNIAPEETLDVQGTFRARDTKLQTSGGEGAIYYNTNYYRYFMIKGDVQIPMDLWDAYSAISPSDLNYTQLFLYTDAPTLNDSLKDMSFKQRDGTSYNVTLRAATPYDKTSVGHWHFNSASNSYVDLPDMNVNWSNGVTIFALVKWDSLNFYSRIIDFGNGQNSDNILLANKATSPDIVYEVYSGTGSGGQVNLSNFITPGEWVAIAVRQEPGTPGTNVNTYIYAVKYNSTNGKLVYANVTGSTYLPPSVNRVNNYIGRSNWGGDDYFEGDMIHLSVYNKDLGENVVWRVLLYMLRDFTYETS